MSEQVSETEESGGHLSTRFWPSTFEERGVVVPFTTPMLAFARVRQDRNEALEVLVPGMSGGAGTYVIGWASIPEMFRLSVHDRALHEKILEDKASTPRGMRRCAQEIAMTGLAGIDAVEGSKKAHQEEENERLLTNYFLISATVEAMAPGAAKLTLADVTSSAGKKKTRGILDGVAGKLGISSEQLYNHLEVWSDMVAPVGLAAMPQECRLRRLLKDLEQFKSMISGWGERTNADTDGFGTLTGEVARLTIEIAYEIVWSIDDYVGQMPNTLRNWAQNEPELKELLDRLSWVLDGWEHVLAIWNASADGPIYQQAEALAEMVRMLPLVPKKELDALKSQAWGKLENAMRSHVRQLQGWQTGETDLELALRIEKRRAAAL
jgi:hypothetical protein